MCKRKWPHFFAVLSTLDGRPAIPCCKRICINGLNGLLMHLLNISLPLQFVGYVRQLVVPFLPETAHERAFQKAVDG